MKNKGADQTAQMRRLVCACVVRKPLKTGFLRLRPMLKDNIPILHGKKVALSYGPRPEKTCLRGFVNNKDTDQPAYTRSMQSDQRLYYPLI